MTDGSTQRSYDEESFNFAELLTTQNDIDIPSKKYPELKLDLQGFPGVSPNPPVEEKSKKAKGKKSKNELTLETLNTQAE